MVNGARKRFVLVLRGKGLSDAVADTDPQAEGVAPLPARATAPEGEATAFDASVERLYCFTALNGAAGQVIHAWYQGDSLRAKVTLNKGEAGRWRTHSSKSMVPEWQGAWRVDVLDENGNVLKSAEFTYGEAKANE